MISIDGSGDIPEFARGAIVTVGNFDGVHRGHQRLLARVRARADAAGVPALAITFDPHPVALLRPEAAPVPLVWLDREISLLHEAGASLVGVFRTGPWLLELTAREFFDRILCEQLGVRGIVEGPNFAFGHDRTGDVRTLESWCGEAGIEFEVVDLAVIDDRLISSSLIRQCLREGTGRSGQRVISAARIESAALYREEQAAAPRSAFPRSTWRAPIRSCLPKASTRAWHTWTATNAPGPRLATSGPNPTFGDLSRKIEAHLIGFSGDLYGKHVELDFLEQLRHTRKFAGRDELLAQIAADVQETEPHLPPGSLGPHAFGRCS